MISLGNFGSTTKLPVTTTSATYEGVRPWATYVIHSDRAIHIKRGPDELVEATDEDFHLTSDNYAKIEIPEGEYIAFVLADGETDGSVYITPAT